MLFSLLFVGTVTEGKYLFISRALGNDTWSCDQSKPCKTISRAVELASIGDHILLDGNNTDKDPYNCQSRSPELSGVQINKSLSIMGYGSFMPHIQCNKGAGLQFKGSNNEQQMNVTLSTLLVSQSAIMVQDSSVHIDGCRFTGSNQGVVINIRARLSLNILVTNSIFYNNSGCISVVVNSTTKHSKNIQVIFRMTNSSLLYGNVVNDVGRCISFTESQNSGQSVSCNITLENTTFFGNKFILPQGIIFLGINNGSQHIQFKTVTFFDNGISSMREDLMDDSVLCIVRSTDVNISISSNTFSSDYAKVLNGSAEDISFHIYNSTFCGHRGRTNGGVISLQGSNLCKLNVSKSSFVNTSAVVGGAISIDCTTIDVVTLNQNNFTNNTAVKGGGAVYIKAVKASVVLRHLTFTNCKTFNGFGSGVLINTTLDPRNKTSGNDLVLTVESCRFVGCGTKAISSSGGSLDVIYKTQTKINISNSNFISNFRALLIWVEPYLPKSTANSNSIKWSYVKIQNCMFLRNRGLGLFSTPVSITVSNQSVIIFRNVIMESNRAFIHPGIGWGGAAFIERDCFLTIEKCRFSKNTASNIGGALSVAVSSLIVKDSLFVGNKVTALRNGYGGALFVTAMSAIIFNSTFSNCSGTYGGAIHAVSRSNITIKKCQFVENNAGHMDKAETGEGGAALLFGTHVLFEETTFYRNTGVWGGAVVLRNSGATFKNCYAADNFAAVQGGFLYAGYDVKGVVIHVQDSVFKQTVAELRSSEFSYKKASFILADSLEELKIFNTTMESTPYYSNGVLLLVTNVTVMDFGKDNSTILNCPIGSQIEILSFTMGIRPKATFIW